MTSLQIAFGLIWLVTCTVALIAGGAPERIVAVTFLVAATASPLVVNLDRLFRGVEFGILLVDALMFIPLLSVALLSARFWPLFIVSLQIMTLLAHLGKTLSLAVLPLGYWRTEVIWSVAQLIIVALGALRHQLRLKRYGIDPAWASQLPADYRRGGKADAA